ncbi:putative transcription factor p65 homolog isoform X2 [Dreissena polymorpha]|nr:putative transcription factor p65 homolog isoform X2 [Dreissena polymorpha]
MENLDFMDPGIQQYLSSDPNLNTAATSKPKGASNQPTRGTPVAGPYVEIVEQPKARGLRFRYECEGRSAGSIPGESSTPERKTFPAIKIHNYSGPAVIVVSCVTKDEPYKPHPHNLVGKDCKKGVCTLRIRDTATVTFPHLGIQCAKKKDVEGNLKLRQEINVDPFQTGFKHKGQNIDLNVVRLCFQVFLPDEQGKITRIVKPVVSQAIHDKKALNDLVICRIDKTSGKAKGGDEVFLLCEKINRDDVRVRFYLEQQGHVVWEAFGDFGQNDVHRQFAIVFKTPPYMDEDIQQPVEVEMQLQRSSDLEGSDPIRFTYQPEDPDPDRIAEKRKRKANNLAIFTSSGDSGPVTQEQLKQRLKLKATRVNKPKSEVIVKDEAYSPELPQYSLNNLGAHPQSMNSVMSVAGYQVSQPSFMDQSSPMGSQSNLVSNKLHFNPVTTQVPQVQPSLAQAPQFTLNAQAIQLLMSHGYLNNSQQPATQSNPVLPQPVQLPVQSQPPIQQDVQGNQVQDQIKLLLQMLAQQQNQSQMGAGNQPTNTPFITSNDPSFQGTSLDLSSFDQNVLQSLLAGESPMISLGELEGDLSYDQGVAGFETVGTDGSSSQGSHMYDDSRSHGAE